MQYLSVSYSFSRCIEKFSFPGVNEEYHVHPLRMRFNRVKREIDLTLLFKNKFLRFLHVLHVVFTFSFIFVLHFVHIISFLLYEFTTVTTILISFFFVIKQATELLKQRF